MSNTNTTKKDDLKNDKTKDDLKNDKTKDDLKDDKTKDDLKEDKDKDKNKKIKKEEPKIPNTLTIYIKTRIPNYTKLIYEPYMTVPTSKSHTVYFDPLVEYIKGAIKIYSIF